MKLFALTAVLSQHIFLGLCQQCLPDSACLLIMDDDNTSFIASDSPIQAIVPADARGRSRSSRPDPNAGGDAGAVCFLCGEAVATAKIFKYQTMTLHPQCALACRAHWRILDPKDRKIDQKFRETNPEEWKAPVLGLVTKGGAKRSIKGHRDKLVHLTGFRETSSNKEQVLLTKRRFKQFMKFWEGYESDSGSESWERRYAASEASHRDSEDERQVRTRGSSTITNRTGRLTTKKNPDNGGGPRPSPRHSLNRSRRDHDDSVKTYLQQ